MPIKLKVTRNSGPENEHQSSLKHINQGQKTEYEFCLFDRLTEYSIICNDFGPCAEIA